MDVLLGPGINIKRSPLCGRNFEYYSEDPYLAGTLVASLIEGVQSYGVSATVKHFAVNNQEYERQVMSAFVDERALREIYLKPFEIAVKKAKPGCVMCSYNQVNGTFASENKRLLTDILRGEWGYEGLVMSDWCAVNDRVRGVRAGLDLEMPACKPNTQRIVEAVKQNHLSESEVDVCLERLHTLCKSAASRPDKARKTEHRAFAKELLDQSIVLLKNDGGTLPLRDDGRPLVVGAFAQTPRYQGGGSANVRTGSVPDFLSVCGYPHDYCKGYTLHGNGVSRKLLREAVAKAKQAETIVVFAGLPDAYEKEGFDRRNMRLPRGQVELIEALRALGRRMVLVLLCGSTVELPPLDGIGAVLHAYLGGETLGESIRDILYGQVNPSGKLMESFPLSYGENLVSRYFSYSNRLAEYRESIFVGYRYYDKAEKPVLFPFGHGLSYTAFSYGPVAVRQEKASVCLTCSVTNTGGVRGAQVVQVYVGKPDSAVTRAVRELKAFGKVWLEPGETKTIALTVSTDSLAFYDAAQGRFVVEDGAYVFSVGTSSRDFFAEETVRIAGETVQPCKIPAYEALRDAQEIPQSVFDALLGEATAACKKAMMERTFLHFNASISDYLAHFPHRIKAPYVRWLLRSNQIMETPIRRERYMAGKGPFAPEEKQD